MSILKYRIEKIITKKFHLNNIEQLENLKLSLSFQFKVCIEECLVVCLSQFKYTEDKDDVMELELESYFKVEEECFKSLIENGILTIKPDMLQYMATIAVGTARGEIHARSELAKSKLQEIVLPPINLTKIIITPSEFNV